MEMNSASARTAAPEIATPEIADRAAAAPVTSGPLGGPVLPAIDSVLHVIEQHGPEVAALLRFLTGLIPSL
jgi:hypothetical protein